MRQDEDKLDSRVMAIQLPQETDCRKLCISRQEAHLNSPLTTSRIWTPLETHLSCCIHRVAASFVVEVEQ